jgi:hypothetical protein
MACFLERQGASLHPKPAAENSPENDLYPWIKRPLGRGVGPRLGVWDYSGMWAPRFINWVKTIAVLYSYLSISA